MERIKILVNGTRTDFKEQLRSWSSSFAPTLAAEDYDIRCPYTVLCDLSVKDAKQLHKKLCSVIDHRELDFIDAVFPRNAEVTPSVILGPAVARQEKLI